MASDSKHNESVTVALMQRGYTELEIQEAFDSVAFQGDVAKYSNALQQYMNEQSTDAFGDELDDEKIEQFVISPKSADSAISPRKLKSFAWDPREGHRGKYIHFKGSDTVYHTPPKSPTGSGVDVRGCSSIFVARNVISPADGFRHVHWEVTVEKPDAKEGGKAPANDEVCFRIGFVNAPIRDSVSNFNGYLADRDSKSKKFQTAAQVTGWSAQKRNCVDLIMEGCVFEDVKPKDLMLKPKHLKVANRNHSFGDRYELLFDFENKRVAMVYNGDFLCFIHCELDRAVVPAMSFNTDWNTKVKAVCTRWEAR